MAIPLRNDRPRRTFPWVTLGLLVANVAIFLFVQPVGFQEAVTEEQAQEQAWVVAETEEFAYRWGAVACEITTGELVADDPDGCTGERAETLPENKSIPISLVTAMFLHGNIAHLAGNMLFLWVFAASVEDRLGRGNFLALYLVGGILATLGYVALNSSSAQPLVGASGAIAVAMGAYLVLFPRARVLTVITTVAFQVVYVPAAVVLALFFATQFITAFLATDDNVAWEAHAVGMVAGVLGALVLARVPAVRRRADLDADDADLRLGSSF
ncbi:MAG: rhomboid family intramembrane serine protease [Acidimicrobiales bacterium]|nr:rhomboid family intramembrane serine protease [Acidimicrobiales bacterium]